MKTKVSVIETCITLYKNNIVIEKMAAKVEISKNIGFSDDV